MNVLEILGLVFIATSAVNFIIGFFAVKTPLNIDFTEDQELIEKKNLTGIYN